MLACHHMHAHWKFPSLWTQLEQVESRYSLYVGKERPQRQYTGTMLQTCNKLQKLRKFLHSNQRNRKKTTIVVRLDPDIPGLVSAVHWLPICRKVLCLLMAECDSCSCKKALTRGPHRHILWCDLTRLQTIVALLGIRKAEQRPAKATSLEKGSFNAWFIWPAEIESINQ